MKTNAIYILASRYDLFDMQIKTFFYKNEMKENDLYIVVDEKPDVKIEHFQEIIKQNDNPNFIPENVLKLSYIEDKVAELLDLSEKGKKCLELYKMSGTQCPFLYFNEMGYGVTLLLEDDMFIVGPIEELTRTQKEHSCRSWGKITWPKYKKGQLASQHPEVYRILGIDEDKFNSMRGFYDQILIRAPSVFGDAFCSSLKSMFKNYLESDFIANLWTEQGYDANSRNKISYKLFHHDVVINQNVFYDAWCKNPDKVLGQFTKTQAVAGRNYFKKDFEKNVINSLKYYVIHFTVGDEKFDSMKRCFDYLNKINYKGENSEEVLKSCNRRWYLEKMWYLNQAYAKGYVTDEELEAYRNGTWLNSNAIKETKACSRKQINNFLNKVTPLIDT